MIATVTSNVLFMPRLTSWPRLAGGPLLKVHSRIEPSVQPMSANAPVLAIATDVGASSNETRWPCAAARRLLADSSCAVVAGLGAGGASAATSMPHCPAAGAGVASLVAGSMAAVLVVRRSLAQRARLARSAGL